MAFQYDIIIVGGGGAVLRAAISIGETNLELKVIMVSKVYPIRSNSFAAEGVSPVSSRIMIDLAINARKP